MSGKHKFTHWVVSLLFTGAWLLQCISPLLMQQMNRHHSEAMTCSLKGDCVSSSMHKNQTCDCKHAIDNNTEEHVVTLCGCKYHGNELFGPASPFQIKILLLSTFHPLTFSKKTLFSPPNQRRFLIISDDIFHPPRLFA